jgi:hypothetical protein
MEVENSDGMGNKPGTLESPFSSSFAAAFWLGAAV